MWAWAAFFTALCVLLSVLALMELYSAPFLARNDRWEDTGDDEWIIGVHTQTILIAGLHVLCNVVCLWTLQKI